MATGPKRNPDKGAAPTNRALATALKEAGCSLASLALRVNELGRRQGAEPHYAKASVTRWLRGQQPRGGTPALIAAVLSERLSRPLSPADPGFAADQRRPVVSRAPSSTGKTWGEPLHRLAALGLHRHIPAYPARLGTVRGRGSDHPPAFLAALARRVRKAPS